ncbi:hypothetical protein [Streptomyces sp. AF1A]|jgi:hypothetical protein|uniref:hypothetical protein n=1 Tax=Streptomyces sp. AF1A TaxID=3394350 RepID=UPI0039BC598A
MSAKRPGAYMLDGRIYLVDTDDYALVIDARGEVIGEGCDFSSYLHEYLGRDDLE